MSQLSEKELVLMTAMFKHSDVNIMASVNWDNVALHANYKDARNARTMGSRLVKKLTGSTTGAAAPAPAPATQGDNENADEGNSKPGTAARGKKRKATSTPEGDSAPAKGGRATKKPKATKAKSSVVETEDDATVADTEELIEEESAEASNA